jgi:hypothetical protein
MTNGIVTSLSVISMLTLLFLIVDASRLCIYWVRSLHGNIEWGNSRLAGFVNEHKLPADHAEAWLKIHLIGERTAVITRLIYYPVIIILLMLLSRSTFFDNWDFPQPLAIVISLNFIIALGSIVILNFAAQRAREGILDHLEREQIAGDSEKVEATTSERRELIEQLKSLKTGAYQPVWQQPPVRATLMLIGGFALTFAEYFNIFLT